MRTSLTLANQCQEQWDRNEGERVLEAGWWRLNRYSLKYVYGAQNQIDVLFLFAKYLFDQINLGNTHTHTQPPGD